MNRSLIPLLFSFFSLSVSGQSRSVDSIPPYLVGPGEYQCFIINTCTGKLYGISSSLVTAGVEWNSGIAGLPVLVGHFQDRSFIDVASGLHNSLAVDSEGNV